MRDNYAVGEDRLLMIATDRLSAFDVVMSEPIPSKGVILTTMALFWFNVLSELISNHLTGEDPESVVLPDEVDQIRGRSMLVKRLNPIPVEAVVRGYLVGSAWKEYQAGQSVCGIPLQAGLRLASRLPEPIFTPATKAVAGEHDENITFDRFVELVGTDFAHQIRDISIKIYLRASEIAEAKGIIIADTKLEFGIDGQGNIVLMDEVLTPDSSRFWDKDSYVEGVNPASYDKQFVRDWLETATVDGLKWNKQPPPPSMPAAIVLQTAEKYRNALIKITK